MIPSLSCGRRVWQTSDNVINAVQDQARPLSSQQTTELGSKSDVFKKESVKYQSKIIFLYTHPELNKLQKHEWTFNLSKQDLVHEFSPKSLVATSISNVLVGLGGGGVTSPKTADNVIGLFLTNLSKQQMFVPKKKIDKKRRLLTCARYHGTCSGTRICAHVTVPGLVLTMMVTFPT